MLLPLLVEETVSVLCEGRRVTLAFGPVAETLLEGEELPGLGGKERAIHVGI